MTNDLLRWAKQDARQAAKELAIANEGVGVTITEAERASFEHAWKIADAKVFKMLKKEWSGVAA